MVSTRALAAKCAECRKNRETALQRAAVNASPVSEVPPIVHEVLRSPGQPLDAATRVFMEPRFGHDFSQVRVHTDGLATSLQSGGALPHVRGEAIQLTAESSPTQLGQQIARSVYSGIGKAK